MSFGSAQNPLHAAIVGSGPSGFYAAEALLKSPVHVLVDMFERLPSPFGLVRSGVAPDHPKLKEPIRVYQQIAESQQFRFLGNVAVGTDISVRELQDRYHAVILACGASADRQLGIPGEDLAGSHAATEFVGWYNGHPDYRDLEFDLSHEVAVIIGQGNVAVDVCRILCKSAGDLRHTDIAEHALDVLSRSKIRDVYMIGRRGPVQAKFTHQELRELGQLRDCDPVVSPNDLELNPQSCVELSDKRNRSSSKSFEVLQTFASRASPTQHRRCHIQFLKSPRELQGEGRLERVVLVKNRLEGEPFNQVARATSEMETLECGLLLRSIGYKGVPIPGVPFDDSKSIIPSQEGRIVVGDSVVPGLYVTGWIKRGPTGIIGTNRADSVATVASLVSDIPNLTRNTKSGADRIVELLIAREVRVVCYSDWQKIDSAEIRRGVGVGKPREKYTREREMLEILDH